MDGMWSYVEKYGDMEGYRGNMEGIGRQVDEKNG